MYLSDFHAFVCVRSRSDRKWLDVPGISLQDLQNARYVLFHNHPEKIEMPMKLDVYKARVEIECTDFYHSLLTDYPSLEYVGRHDNRVGQNGRPFLLMHDEFDVIKFLLMYTD